MEPRIRKKTYLQASYPYVKDAVCPSDCCNWLLRVPRGWAFLVRVNHFQWGKGALTVVRNSITVWAIMSLEDEDFAEMLCPWISQLTCLIAFCEMQEVIVCISSCFPALRIYSCRWGTCNYKVRRNRDLWSRKLWHVQIETQKDSTQSRCTDPYRMNCYGRGNLHMLVQISHCFWRAYIYVHRDLTTGLI